MNPFSKKNMELVLRPLGRSNPITVQVLGICSALAVTVQVKSALVMGASVMAVTAFSSLIISAMRNAIPGRIRIIVQLAVVAAFVILIDQLLKAYMFDTWRNLSVFIGLIITNCIIMGRIEAFALGNTPWKSFLDGLGSGLGYALILLTVAVVREFFGTGTLFGFEPLKHFMTDTLGYVPNGFMILPPMALIILGIIVWVQRSMDKSLQEKEQDGW